MPYTEWLVSVTALCAGLAVRSMWGGGRKSPRRREDEPRLPRLTAFDEDDEVTSETSMSTQLPNLAAADDDALIEEPTCSAAFSVTASARTDTGRVRGHNEDSFLLRDDLGLFVVADGMGGHRGGDVASRIAVHTIGEAFDRDRFEGRTPTSLPARAGKLARAISMANSSVHARARSDQALRGMGTTVVAALFSPEKRRVYIGHIGDSRCYRLRGEKLEQLTNDHTMASLGFQGAAAERLSRAVGPSRRVKSDLVVAQPVFGDVYVLCSDGLSKMVPDEDIRDLLCEHAHPRRAADRLVAAANARGGKDNVTAVVVRVDSRARTAP